MANERAVKQAHILVENAGNLAGIRQTHILIENTGGLVGIGQTHILIEGVRKYITTKQTFIYVELVQLSKLGFISNTAISHNAGLASGYLSCAATREIESLGRGHVYGGAL